LSWALPCEIRSENNFRTGWALCAAENLFYHLSWALPCEIRSENNFLTVWALCAAENLFYHFSRALRRGNSFITFPGIKRGRCFGDFSITSAAASFCWFFKNKAKIKK